MTKTTERHQALLHMLNARGYATIDELTKCFSVTPQTIRKDINTLAGQGKVQRFHGGVGMPLSTENILYEQRKKLFLPEKKAIAQMLAKHIPDGASICINLGTTTEEVAHALLGHTNLRVLTNNLNVAAIMARNPNFDVVVAGGTVRHHDHGIIGPSAENFIRDFRHRSGRQHAGFRLQGGLRGPDHHRMLAPGLPGHGQFQIRPFRHGPGGQRL